jgi:hypothetical protein
MFRVRLLLKRDQLAAAEELLPIAIKSPGAHGIEARETLVASLRLEGRFAEMRPLIQKGWNSYPDRIGLLRALAYLDSVNPVPIEQIRPALEGWKSCSRTHPATSRHSSGSRSWSCVPGSLIVRLSSASERLSWIGQRFVTKRS